MDDLVFESQWGARFSVPIQTNLGSTHPCVRWEPGLVPGVKWPWCSVDHPPQSSAYAKEVECTSTPSLYLYGMLQGEILLLYTIMVEAVGSSEIPVHYYHTTWHHILDSSQLLRDFTLLS
jgi:hypothetical protein